MSKVVYLMGAGASYGKRWKDATGKDLWGKIFEGLPIVSEIPDRLEHIKTLFTQETISEYSETQKELEHDFNWLIDNTRRHATIDTFAKKLFLTNQTAEYTKLKRLLSLYFKAEQLINRPDGRYDTFLASVLQKNSKGKLRISDDITILTWNYDSQFEIAYKEYLSAGDYQEDIDFPERLGVHIHSNIADFIKPSTSEDDGARQIFKLNGSASFIGDYSMGHYYEYNDGKITLQRKKDLLKIYAAPYYPDGSPKKSMLNFAWEYEKTPEYINLLDNSISGAESLVIIGYTFPFFNREVDSFLFKFLWRHLRNIYIQDPNANNLKEVVLNTIHNAGGLYESSNIHTINNTDQFFLPPEL